MTLVTFQQHILLEQHKFPQASGEFSWLLSGITLATKLIEAQVRRAGLTNILGAVDDSHNVHGENQQNLDVYANEAMVNALRVRENVAVLISEEVSNPIHLPREPGKARYAVIFDPLDGSSNIDVNVSVGTIFSIVRLSRPVNSTDDIDAVMLHPGHTQVAAGYVIYGSSTVLCYTAGNGVHGFTLDPAIGAYILSHENIRMPEQGLYYSLNEANSPAFPPYVRDYIRSLRDGELDRGYSSRYIGSLVSDFHRTMLKGGVFLYPPTATYPNGKLRLLYEANPIAFLAEQSGGMATAGDERILDVQPTSIHQRTPLYVGSQAEMQMLERYRVAAQKEVGASK